MKVFARTAFRYNGIDYPYGWQDVTQVLSDTLTAAGYVTLNDDPVKSVPYASLEERPSAAIFGKGTATIINLNYTISCTSDKLSWISSGYSDLLSDRPSAAALGKGKWLCDSTLYLSDGESYTTSGKTVVTPETYLADKSGLTNSTTALLNFYNKAILDGAGHINDGIYLVTEGVLAFDTGNIEKTFPIITTGDNVVFKAAGINNASILSFTNGTSNDGSGKYWVGGSHGKINFLDESGGVAANGHGLTLRGLYKTRFDTVSGTGLLADVVHFEKKLYGGLVPDPYMIGFCDFKGIEGTNCAGWTLNNDNYVGFNGCNIEYITCGDGGLGAWRGFGAGNTVGRMSIGNTSGWGLDDGLDKTGGNSSRLKIGPCEFDNVENICRLTFLNEFEIGPIRIIHKYHTGKNTSLNYWPIEGINLGSVVNGTVYNGKIRIIHRFDAGGVLADVGNIINGNNSVNIATTTIDNVISDNASLGIVGSDLVKNIASIAQGIEIRHRGYKVYDSNVRVGGSVSMSAAVSIPVSGFGTANAKIPYTAEIYDKGNLIDATGNWLVIPISGPYDFKAIINLASPIGTHIRMAAAYDRGGVVNGLGYRSYYSTNAGVLSYELNLGSCPLLAGDKVFFMAVQDTAAPIPLSVTLTAMDNQWSCFLVDN